MAKKINTSASIASLRHKDKRKNIPTEELRDFVVEDESKPKAVLYPRNPDLDPQLVWKGKDQQDSSPLEVPAVPIYIQEKIHPQAIIEDFRRTAPAPAGGDGKAGASPELNLFADFNGLPEEFEQRVDFYHHDGHWSNRMILGDSLLVMNSLVEKEGLRGKVQTIFLDPPYGIKFGSNWQVSTRKRDVKDGKAEDLVRQPEQIKAFRDTWELGIHSYLAYLRDRLVVARDLLTESGSVFVQIGDENVHLVRNVLDEVFGSANSVSIIQFAKTSSASSDLLPGIADYVLWYAKDVEVVKYRPIYRAKTPGEEGASKYDGVELANGIRRLMATNERDRSSHMPQECRVFTVDQLTSQRPPGSDPFAFHGKTYVPVTGYWKTAVDGLHRLAKANRVVSAGNRVRYIRYLDDFSVFGLNNIWTDIGSVQSRTDPKVYVVQTATSVIERCVLMTTDPGDLVLDPTCGSGTTAYVAEEWGRRWITIDTSRVAVALARTRLMCGRFPYFLLADSPEGRKQERGLSGEMVNSDSHPSPLSPQGEGDSGDIRQGFVYKRVPHVTLKSIANNDEIDAIHARWEQKLEPLRARINKLLKTKWEAWEIPRLPDPNLDDDAKAKAFQRLGFKADCEAAGLIAQWWDARRGRQKEIDASIARHADTETLFDQPYEDKKRVRVTGPFTMESLSPHRTISVEEKKTLAEVGDSKIGVKAKLIGPDTFGHMVLDHLKTAGVQNTRKNERLKFDSIEPYPGQWLHGEGRYTDSDGKARRAAICIGPEHGTVGPQLVKEAAKEAVQGVGFDMLLVCGFAFDPHVSEEVKRYGKLTVLPVRMNPDLSMGDLLKKTGAANLFMVFGEPDMEIIQIPATPAKNGNPGTPAQIAVVIKGLDVYDPTTGQIRSSTTDDIACWFIDTDYNGESFFVRHAYFTGADEPYEKLKRALRAEIDEAAWSELYATRSRPFNKPQGQAGKPGKIAVKVINHYGDEVLKVYEVK